jgi:hypothetical protein
MLVNYLYIMHLNTFFSEKVSIGFTGLSKGSMAQKGLRTAVLSEVNYIQRHMPAYPAN